MHPKRVQVQLFVMTEVNFLEMTKISDISMQGHRKVWKSGGLVVV